MNIVAKDSSFLNEESSFLNGAVYILVFFDCLVNICNRNQNDAIIQLFDLQVLMIIIN